MANLPTLLTNTKPAERSCAWCSARKGRVHAAACPLGERYQQIQSVGGVAFTLHCADCGKGLTENESHTCKQQRAANRKAAKTLASR